MAAAIWGFRQGWGRDLGIGPTSSLRSTSDANGLLLTGNSETVYGIRSST